MSSLSEDELLDALHWTTESYNLAEFVDEFSLPQVVRVERGHDGGTDSSTLGYGEVLTLHAIRETRILAAEDYKNGNAIAIGLNFPEEFQLLPQTKDCSLSTCGVSELPMLYQAVKYIEVTEAHYGTSNNVDSADQGELLEILDISKPHKPDKTKVQVRNVENDQKSTLTSTCTAHFRPLLDWKRYRAPDLKTHQFGFPVRVRIFDAENDTSGEDTEYQRLISKCPDLNVIDERNDIVVITTTVASCHELKFCYEIPKDMEIRVAVAEGFSNGAKHYTDIVTNLNERFNVTHFMASHQPALVKRRDVIKQYDYEIINKYITDKSMPSANFDKVEQDEGAPVLPPRKKEDGVNDRPSIMPRTQHKKIEMTKSVDIPPTTPQRPQVAKKMFPRKNSAPDIENVVRRPKPAVQPRVRASSMLDGTGDTPVAPTDLSQRTKNNPSNGLPHIKDGARASPQFMPRKQPLPDPKKYDSISELQSNKVTETRQATNQTHQTPSKPLAETGSIPVESQNVPQTTNIYPELPSQIEKEDNAKTTAQVSSPKLPQRNYPSRSNSNSFTYVPKLPPKSPARSKKFPGNAWQVLPVSPNTSEYDVPAYVKPGILPGSSDVSEYQQPFVPPVPQNVHPIPPDGPQYEAPWIPLASSKASSPPSCPRNPSVGRRFQRTPTPPSGNEQDDDQLYDELIGFDSNPKVMPVAPIPKEISEENPYEISKIPLDLSGLSVMEVSDILRNFNMGMYAERFEEEMIDGDLLKELKERDLETFQMQSLHRTKLLKFINGWRPRHTPKKHAF